MDYSWIQISDLHIFNNTETKMVEAAFSKIAEKHKICFAVITGDLHQYGTSYEKTSCFLETVRKAFCLEKTDLFIVPGNHDSEECKNKKHITFYNDKNVDDDPDCYADSFVKGQLVDCFDSYNTFIHDYYGDECPYENPEQVCIKTWKNKINIIHLNTAINCNGNNSLQCIVDIRGLVNIEVDNNFPCIAIAHHPFSSIHISQQNFLKRLFTDWKLSAYLCGDLHKEFLDKIDTHSSTLSTIPCFVCGKTTPETKDKYSDMGCIVYEVADDRVDVMPYAWNVNSKRFDLYMGMSSDKGFPKFALVRSVDAPTELNQVPPSDITREENLPIWLPDAEFADGPQARFESYTKTNIIDRFLKDDSLVWGLSAVRGVGKTFILQIMRSKLRKDKLKLPIGVEPTKFNNWGTEKIDIRDSSDFTGMKEFKNVVTFWEYCITVYSINQLINCQNHLYNLSTQTKYCIEQLSKGIADFFYAGKIDSLTIQLCLSNDVDGLNYIVSEVINCMGWYNFIDKDYVVLQRLKNRMENLIRSLNKSSVLILIDKLDQAVTQTNTEMPDCDGCEKKNRVNLCDNKNKKDSYCKNADCQKNCCYGCEIYQTIYSSNGLRIYGEGNKRLWHINVWQYIQQGLVEAVYNISTQFQGIIRVYYTIRQEAFAREDGLLGNQGKKMRYTVAELWYSKEEQKRIFYGCIREEDPCYLFNKEYLKKNLYEMAFVGTDKLCHPFVKELSESVFDSIYRHSFDRARDIQEYGRCLSNIISDLKVCKNNAERGEKVKKCIEDHAASLAFSIDEGGTLNDSCYYAEKKILLPNFWANTNNFSKFLKYFSKNLLFPGEARKLCRDFNRDIFNHDIVHCDSKNCSNCSLHPFSMMYKLGMLGRIRITQSNDDDIEQDFIHSKLVTYITGTDINPIQDNTIYVLHPALTKSIDHGIKPIRHFCGFIIGKGLKVEKTLLIRLQEEYKRDKKGFNKKYFCDGVY